MKVRVLIVDDAALLRTALTRELSGDGELDVRMPQEAIALGAAAKVAPLSRVARVMLDLASGRVVPKETA